MKSFEGPSRRFDESRGNMREEVTLEINRDLIKAQLVGARRRLDHAVQMNQLRPEVIAAEAALAKLKGQPQPQLPEDFDHKLLAARKETEELESQLAEVERRFAELQKRRI